MDLEARRLNEEEHRRKNPEEEKQNAFELDNLWVTEVRHGNLMVSDSHSPADHGGTNPGKVAASTKPRDLAFDES